MPDVVTGLRFLDGKLQQQLADHWEHGLSSRNQWVDVPLVTQAELDRAELRRQRRVDAYHTRHSLLMKIASRESWKRIQKQYPPKP
jgi:hypothetical protein